MNTYHIGRLNVLLNLGKSEKKPDLTIFHGRKGTQRKPYRPHRYAER